MTLSTQLLDERQADTARREQKRYNSWRERSKRLRQEQKAVKASNIMRLYRDILPTFLAHAFDVNVTQVVEMKCSNWRLSNRYNLIYLVDDIFIGIIFSSRKKWLIKHFTGSAVNGCIIFCGKYNGFTIQHSHIMFFNKGGLKLALAKAEDRKLISMSFQDSPQLRELLGLTIRQ